MTQAPNYSPMRLVFECIWSEPGYQPRLPAELWEYDAAQQIIRNCKCDAALLPFSLFVRDSILYDSNAVPLSSTALISMHEIEVADPDLFCEPVLCEIKASSQLLPEQEDMKKDIESLISEFSCLFSTGKNDLGKVADVCHEINLKPDSYPPTKLRSMSSYSERERERESSS